MKLKMKLKIFIDFIMTILLLFQMAYMLIGNTLHEWIGTVLFVLFILHNTLNIKWYSNLGKRRSSGFRILQTVVNLSLLLCMVNLMVSGMMMSRVVFSFLPIDGGMGFARIMHMAAAYWGFFLMSVHLGLHWKMIMGLVRKVMRKREASTSQTWGLRILAVSVSGFGIYAFQKHNLTSYMLLKNQFVFFDMQQSLISFLAEYLAMMVLWACLSYYTSQRLKK
ncbi:MAG: DUF4405 domain-containing protein [Emergencia sp.]